MTAWPMRIVGTIPLPGGGISTFHVVGVAIIALWVVTSATIFPSPLGNRPKFTVKIGLTGQVWSARWPCTA